MRGFFSRVIADTRRASAVAVQPARAAGPPPGADPGPRGEVGAPMSGPSSEGPGPSRETSVSGPVAPPPASQTMIRPNPPEPPATRLIPVERVRAADGGEGTLPRSPESVTPAPAAHASDRDDGATPPLAPPRPGPARAPDPVWPADRAVAPPPAHGRPDLPSRSRGSDEPGSDDSSEPPTAVRPAAPATAGRPSPETGAPPADPPRRVAQSTLPPSPAAQTRAMADLPPAPVPHPTAPQRETLPAPTLPSPPPGPFALTGARSQTGAREAPPSRPDRAAPAPAREAIRPAAAPPAPPAVEIGRIDVFVAAPPPQPAGRGPAPARAGAASRLYLRRL
jgi:hypothetical protein